MKRKFNNKKIEAMKEIFQILSQHEVNQSFTKIQVLEMLNDAKDNNKTIDEVIEKLV